MNESTSTVSRNSNATDMVTGKMAAGPGAMHVNSTLVNASSMSAHRNLQVTWFSYGFALALVLISLYFFFMVRRQTDLSGKKRSLITGAVLFALALLLWILPARFFPTPVPPENFDMRAT